MLLRTPALVGIALALPSIALAQRAPQQPDWSESHFTLMAGVSVFQRSGSGTMGIYAARVDIPMYPSLLLEAGLSYAHRGQSQGVADIFIPGMQMQLQATSGQFNPYAGLGMGLTVERAAGGGSSDVSFSPSFSTGLRIALTEGAGLRLEGRLNAVGGNFRGIYSEMTGGLSIAF
jgi:hypothetical protein